METQGASATGGMTERIQARGPAARFLLHLGEMVVAMMVGMMVLGLAYDGAMGAFGVDEPAVRFPELSGLVTALTMAVPMAAWMRRKGHDWSRVAEMSGAMFVPAVLLIVLFWSGTVPALAVSHAQHPLMVPVTAIAMLVRRRDYME